MKNATHSNVPHRYCDGEGLKKRNSVVSPGSLIAVVRWFYRRRSRPLMLIISATCPKCWHYSNLRRNGERSRV